MAGQVEIEARAYGPESTPEEIAGRPHSHTGRFLMPVLAKG